MRIISFVFALSTVLSEVYVALSKDSNKDISDPRPFICETYYSEDGTKAFCVDITGRKGGFYKLRRPWDTLNFTREGLFDLKETEWGPK